MWDIVILYKQIMMLKVMFVADRETVDLKLVVADRYESKSFCPSLLSPTMIPSPDKCGALTDWYGGNTFNFEVNNNLCEPLNCTDSNFQMNKGTGYSVYTLDPPGLYTVFSLSIYQ